MNVFWFFALIFSHQQCNGANIGHGSSAGVTEKIASADPAGASNEPVIEDSAFWQNVARKQLKRTIETSKKQSDQSHLKKAKNIIIFIGDGMGMTTITAGRIHKGQQSSTNSRGGEEAMLSFDSFPHTGLAKTYNLDRQVPDSASTATAIFCGVKTFHNTLGLDETRNKKNATQGRVNSIMTWAQKAGKRTGIVTTTRITHATPAATYAGIYHRDWECDTEVPADSNHIDIARQLVENSPGNRFNVIMGGGLSPMGAFNNDEIKTVHFNGKTENICKRGDGRNLTEEWLRIDRGKHNRSHFVQNRDELMQLDVKNVDYLLGLYRNNHITYSIAREQGEPSLNEMVTQAIGVLQRPQSNGFILMVEGGRIDQAHHQNYARAALHEVLELDAAIEAAQRLTNANETLIIVTADHSHALTLNGYPKRGNDILGFANKTAQIRPYETLTYANGPGYHDHLNPALLTLSYDQLNKTTTVWKRLDAIQTERLSPTYRHQATLPLDDETHGGEDVPVYASGPGSSLVRGVFEQNFLAYVVSYAGCIGPAKDIDESCNSSAHSTMTNFTLPVTVITFYFLLICFS